jgi:YD repeat-containing protein
VWPGCHLEAPPYQLPSPCAGSGCARACRSESSSPRGAIEYEYDADGRLTRMASRPGKKAMSFEYRDGRLVTVRRGKYETTLRYEGNRVVEEIAGRGKVRYSYDDAGRITRNVSTWPDGHTTATAFTYGSDGRLQSHDGGTETWTYTYNSDGRVARITNGVSTHAFRYLADGRLDEYELLEHDLPTARIVNHYDARNRLIEETQADGAGKTLKTFRHFYDCPSESTH